MRITTLALASLALAAPLAGQDYRFSKVISAGSRLVINNINGEVRATQGSGRSAEIEVTKTVRKGDGNLVKAVLEEYDGAIQVLQEKLDPGSRESLNRSLRVLDQAIAEASAQRRAEPDDPRAARYLTATLRKKLDVLRSATVLASSRS